MVFSTFLYRAFTAHILVTVAGVLLGGIPRGTGLPRPAVREGTTGDDQPLLGPRALTFQARLHSAPDHLDLYRPFLPVSHPQVHPGIHIEALAPLRHRWPRCLGATAPS